MADILRRYAGDLAGLCGEAIRVVRALTSCRTAALGGHLQRCDLCGEERPVYNSCRNRHCPKCQSLEQARWVEERERDLLPVPYFHVVFTIPDCLNPLFLGNPAVAYAILFEAAARTVIDVSRRRLEATPGIVAVLHTWTQTLLYHPHIHCIVTGGGLSVREKRWISSRPDFFLPVRVLSKVFRGKLLHALDQALVTGRMRTSTGRAPLRHAAAKAFVVYSKAPMAGPKQVLRYLGRYTHRIAIGNERLAEHHDGTVTFTYKDRRDDGRRKEMSLAGREFVRRFLLHVVPRRFVRVRHFGLLAHGVKAGNLTLARKLLDAPQPPEKPGRHEGWHDLYLRLVGEDPTLCPRCHEGHLVTVSELHRQPSTSPFTGRSP